MRFAAAAVAAVILAGTGTACATLGQLGQLAQLVQPPVFERASDQPAEIRLLSPGTTHPLGGAEIRLWTKVSNPNAFGFTLSTLRGTLFLDDARTTTVDLPLGLSLAARGETVFPIDLALSFAELPGLRDIAVRALRHEPIAYRLDGTVGIDAGRFGTPEFGPMTFLRGSFN